jgi:hypothetical protein
MNSRRGVTLAILIGVAGISGCGSSSNSSSSASSASSSTSSSSSGISVAAYRARVNQICLNNNDQIKALPTSVETSLAGLNELLSIAETSFVRIKQIEPPSPIKSSVDAWLAEVGQSEQNAIELVAAVKANDPKKIQSVTTKGDATAVRTKADARALGLPDCAQNANPGGH